MTPPPPVCLKLWVYFPSGPRASGVYLHFLCSSLTSAISVWVYFSLQLRSPHTHTLSLEVCVCVAMTPAFTV